MKRIKLATVWLGGCSGCHMSFLDLDEWLLELAQRVELVYSPLADTKVYPEGVDVALVEGAVANQDHLDMIHQVRDRTKILIAFGGCAVTGNITALRNPLSQTQKTMAENATEGNITEDYGQSVLTRAYLETATHPQLPKSDLLPPLLTQVLPVHKVVDVDLSLPGCPPDAQSIRAVLEPLIAGEMPEHLESKNIQFG